VDKNSFKIFPPKNQKNGGKILPPKKEKKKDWMKRKRIGCKKAGVDDVSG
jgi:hypothetical protein